MILKVLFNTPFFRSTGAVRPCRNILVLCISSPGTNAYKNRTHRHSKSLEEAFYPQFGRGGNTKAQDNGFSESDSGLPEIGLLNAKYQLAGVLQWFRLLHDNKL